LRVPVRQKLPTPALERQKKENGGRGSRRKIGPGLFLKKDFLRRQVRVIPGYGRGGKESPKSF